MYEGYTRDVGNVRGMLLAVWWWGSRGAQTLPAYRVGATMAEEVISPQAGAGEAHTMMTMMIMMTMMMSERVEWDYSQELIDYSIMLMGRRPMMTTMMPKKTGGN